MAGEKFNQDLRMMVNSVLQPLFEQSFSVGYHGGIAALKSLGIPQSLAEELVGEFDMTHKINSKPGNIIDLPEFDPEILPSSEQSEDEIFQGTLWFTLGYVEDATERSDNSVIFNGQIWLGNSTEETRTLVENLQKDPNRVIGYLHWAFQHNHGLDEMFTDYRNRAENNSLRPPSFEE